MNAEPEVAAPAGAPVEPARRTGTKLHRRSGAQRAVRRNTKRAAVYFLRRGGMSRAEARATVHGTGRVSHPTRRALLAASIGVNAARTRARRDARRRAQAHAAAFTTYITT